MAKISIPHRSYCFEAEEKLKDLLLISFQSLIGLIVSIKRIIMTIRTIVFQSLIGLIVSFPPEKFREYRKIFQSLIGLIVSVCKP